jgi:hypothetical protein
VCFFIKKCHDVQDGYWVQQAAVVAELKDVQPRADGENEVEEFGVTLPAFLNELYLMPFAAQALEHLAHI